MRRVYLTCEWDNGYRCCESAPAERNIIAAFDKKKDAELLAKSYHSGHVVVVDMPGIKIKR